MKTTLLALWALALTSACSTDSSKRVLSDGGVSPLGDGGVPVLGVDGSVPQTTGTVDAGKPVRLHTFEWAESLNNSNPTQSDVAAMAADSSGVVIVGQLEGTAQAGTKALSAADMNPLAVKYDTSGNVAWSLMPDPGTGASDARFTAAAIDTAGNTYVTGIFINALNVGGVALALDTANDFSGPAVLAKIDPTGAVTWAKIFQSKSEIIPTGIAFAASGDVLVTGSMQGLAKFDAAGAVTATVDYPGGIFLADFKTTGAAVWAQVIPSMPDAVHGNDNDQGASVATDAQGGVYLASAKNTDTGGGAVIVDKLTLGASAATVAWSVTATNAGGQATEVNAIATDANGDVILIGDTGDSPLQFGSVTVAEDRFIVKLAGATGAASWGKTFNAGAISLAMDGTDSYVFGNATVYTGASEVGMGLFKFDATGKLEALVGCGGQAALGQGVAASAGNVYVGGTITHPGVFGTLDVATDGMFAAKLVTPVTGGVGADD